MKFVSNNKKTHNAVDSWSSSKKAITATYFFWSQGATLQQTQRGVLQTVLYQVLSKMPELINLFDVDPCGGIRQWTEQRLLQVFEAILMDSEISPSLCLFVDGLDENIENPTEVL
ncbi:hypothetical protein F4813DRAFT_399469 [Daldinia decipiens]|uniref:uncharacterized protein n=1 Tax=Daldinia decipiens TaxID=326647 RepID=UPI0020C39A5A|nr:uncharacterized protein F4813DRAFT_399469 [Daldinia decipiens]KAI1654120.1 hypothetical protein F4813DRAFT_399469 [Daldinia decipiens]